MRESNTLVGNATTMENLGEYKRAVHEGIKFPCGQCGKQFSHKGDVAKHQRAVHAGIKYPCGQCDKEFSSMTNLARHRRTLHKDQ